MISECRGKFDLIEEALRDFNSFRSDYKEILSLQIALGRELDSRITALKVEMDRKIDIQPGYYPDAAPVALLKSEPKRTKDDEKIYTLFKDDVNGLKELYKYHDSFIGGNNPFKSLLKQVSAQHGENLMSVPVDELDLEHMTKFYAEHKACGAGNIMLDCASTGIGSCVDIRCVSCGKVQTIYGPETW
jgi:hypothetical protein